MVLVVIRVSEGIAALGLLNYKIFSHVPCVHWPFKHVCEEDQTCANSYHELLQLYYATQVMRGTLILGGPDRLSPGPPGPPFSLSPGAFESPYQGLSIEHPLASNGAAGAERGAPEKSMFCAMRNFGAPRWRGGDAPLRPNGPYGALTSAPLGLVVRRLGER